MTKFALFIFNGDPMVFMHVLLNALDMKSKGHEAKIIIEGLSVKLIPDLVKSENLLHSLWKKSLEEDLIGGVCKACSNQFGTIEEAKKQKLSLLSDMSGHPSMSAYRDHGYEIITF